MLLGFRKFTTGNLGFIDNQGQPFGVNMRTQRCPISAHHHRTLTADHCSLEMGSSDGIRMASISAAATTWQ
jgi:hypothetical protein